MTNMNKLTQAGVALSLTAALTTAGCTDREAVPGDHNYSHTTSAPGSGAPLPNHDTAACSTEPKWLKINPSTFDVRYSEPAGELLNPSAAVQVAKAAAFAIGAESDLANNEGQEVTFKGISRAVGTSNEYADLGTREVMETVAGTGASIVTDVTAYVSGITVDMSKASSDQDPFGKLYDNEGNGKVFISVLATRHCVEVASRA